MIEQTQKELLQSCIRIAWFSNCLEKRKFDVSGSKPLAIARQGLAQEMADKESLKEYLEWMNGQWLNEMRDIEKV